MVLNEYAVLGTKTKALLGVLSHKKAKEGFFMRDLPEFRNRGSLDFQRIIDCFLSRPGLPFASVLSSERIERIFDKHGNLFGVGRVYSTALVLWSFLGQVLRDGKEASCQSAVARIATFQELHGEPVPTSDTGDYCKARSKLSEAALHELSVEIAAEAEEHSSEKWRWKGQRAKLIDGFTFTMPDTAQNQAVYPQQKAQKPGVGFPIARAVAIVSLATGCARDVAIGPYSGKETGESALLRSLLERLSPGDIAVMDRYYCSFMLISLLLSRGTQTCTRRHHLRHSDFRRGQRLGRYDHLIEWVRPQRPKWMNQETYAQIPETLQLREIRYNIIAPGRRTQSIDVITTLINTDEYTKEDIATLYGFRWNSELDIRSIKDSLNLGHVRCKSPEMVHREVWTTILAYNLVRTTAASAALIHGKQPRQISFTGACQYVLASWMQSSGGLVNEDCFGEYCLTMLKQIAACEVANRPHRLEPRVLKKRPKTYKLMQKPRSVLRSELQKRCA